ncbi:hypothetical protein GCM10011507_27280 [Edaphobacter acidisoli]|uniref:Uncharacterized protein n=1 Tax=Edaphobacter acidisoli TaxID=2040573 RepID=A0A916RXR9_9BACT|nr:hypothetical protein [Edaphobacter acidisoli]GGA74404.1 hypothetical protein GCM10011507_27280 [Edaphobacter acidisoli]
MNPSQFRVLYRVFLLRIVDLELLSSDADPTRLIGQFLALFASVSFLFVVLLLFIAGGHLPITSAWMFEHFFIENSMTAAGIILVLNWDAAFPDRRDALVLSPLPIPAATVFLAKITALLVAPLLAVTALNVFIGLIWPALFSPAHSGLPGLFRSVLAYWLTIFLASAFIVFFFLAVQGLAANLLPRQFALRLSAIFQATALCLLLLVYFLEPSLEYPAALAAPQNQHLLAWLPSYWFFGLFQQLNGSMRTVFVPLVHRAWIALGISVLGALVAFVLSYLRALPKIAEQPDILPISRRLRWAPRIGNRLQTAISLFTLRTLLRSRQHRMILSFYLGIGLVIVVAYMKMPIGGHISSRSEINPTILLASVLMMMLAILAIRVVASFPISLRANWIIRVTQLQPARNYQRAVRIAWLALGVAPVWILAAALFMRRYPWQPALGHLAVMLLLGAFLVEVCLYTFPKIPFTCSYLPGKANIHFVFWVCIMVAVQVLYGAAKFESNTLRHLLNSLLMLLALAAAVAIMHALARMHTEPSQNLLFEEEYAPDLITLKLN